jgi:hypothetical protein
MLLLSVEYLKSTISGMPCGVLSLNNEEYFLLLLMFYCLFAFWKGNYCECYSVFFVTNNPKVVGTYVLIWYFW